MGGLGFPQLPLKFYRRLVNSIIIQNLLLQP